MTSKKFIRYIKDTWGVLRQEFMRVFGGAGWYITVCALTILWFVLSMEYGEKTTLQQYFDYVNTLSNEAKIIVLVGALPTAVSFCSDWQDGYINSVLLRSGSRAYITGKLVAAVVVSFLTNFVGTILYCIICGEIFGYGYESISDYYLFYDVSVGSMPFMYFVIFCYKRSIVNTMYAVWGYAMSAVLPNKFVAVTAPMFMAIMIEDITYKGPVQLFPRRIATGNEFLGYDTGINLLLSTIVILGYILIASYIFKKVAERRIRNEIV